MTNDSLAVKWDDLMSYRKTKTPERDDFVFYKVEGTAPNRQLIIQWNNYGIYQSVQEFGTMQAILYEGSNNIQFYYISLLTPGRSDGASGTVGIKVQRVFKPYTHICKRFLPRVSPFAG